MGRSTVRSQANGDALQELLTKGVLPNIVFRSSDVDATFEAVRASGAEVLQEPIDQAWARVTVLFVTHREIPFGSLIKEHVEEDQP